MCIFPKKGFYLIHLTPSEPITIASERLPVCLSAVASSLVCAIVLPPVSLAGSVYLVCVYLSLSLSVCVYALIKLWVVSGMNVFPGVFLVERGEFKWCSSRFSIRPVIRCT